MYYMQSIFPQVPEQIEEIVVKGPKKVKVTTTDKSGTPTTEEFDVKKGSIVIDDVSKNTKSYSYKIHRFWQQVL